jgi:hypothetical protein
MEDKFDDLGMSIIVNEEEQENIPPTIFIQIATAKTSNP